MNCEPCGKIFTGIVSYNQHMDSEKHKRKMINFDMEKALKDNHSNELLANETISQPISRSNEISCSVCNVSFDSLQNYLSHAESLEHATNINKKFQNNANNFRCDAVSSTISNGYLSKESAVLSGDETDTVLPPVASSGISYLTSFTDCKVCNKQFSGPEPYKQHLVSAGHKKKMEMQNCDLGTGGSQNITCQPCNKVFSGHIPYQQHLVSNVHKKKLESIKLLEEWSGKEIKPNFVTGYSPDGVHNPRTGGNGLNDISVSNPWFCKICLIQCSGHVPYQQHLQGESHYKNIRKAEALKGNIEITPENLSMSLLSSFNSNDDVLPQAMLQTEKNGIQNVQGGITIQNIQTPNNNIQNLDIDTILPLPMQNLAIISADKLNLKEFLPEDEINFDSCENNETQNTTNTINVLQETAKDIEEVEVYQECKYCNVQLKSKDDALSHFESLEHYNKRWN